VTPSYADVAWVVGSRWQNNGYAIEAAKAMEEWLLELGVREIRAAIHPGHVASIRVAEHLGLCRTNEYSGNELIWRFLNVPPTTGGHDTATP
jgi:RimJ/RimL family protein N-acetyltransferase